MHIVGLHLTLICSVTLTKSYHLSGLKFFNCKVTSVMIFTRVYLSLNLLFVYLFLAVLGLCCSTGFSLAVVSGVYSLVAARGLLVAVASLAVEQVL